MQFIDHESAEHEVPQLFCCIEDIRALSALANARAALSFS
jgi:hypothetical protein